MENPYYNELSVMQDDVGEKHAQLDYLPCYQKFDRNRLILDGDEWRPSQNSGIHVIFQGGNSDGQE